MHGATIEQRGRVDAPAYEVLLSCPLAWGAFRFVGVCERRPSSTWDPDHERTLAEDEEREVDASLRAAEAAIAAAAAVAR